ncbi:MAG: hypothetical protein JXQ96_17765 [Cyclobacteriaceae bacterium]
MKNLLFTVLALSCASISVAQSKAEVKSYIEDLITNYQSEDYNYDVGYGNLFPDEFLDEFVPGYLGELEALFIMERCNTNFNVCRRNFFDLKGVKRILIKDEQRYLTLRFTMKPGFASKEYVSTIDGWELEESSTFPPMILLSPNSVEQAKKLRKAFIYLSKQLGGNPEGDLF